MASYLYNGVELPALPEWDNVAYPYAVLYGYGTGYAVTITDKPLKLFDFGDEGELFAAQDYSTTNKVYTNYKTSYLNDGSSGWSGFPSYDLSSYGLYCRKYTTDEPNHIWSNHDILNTDGSVYLATSEPIPVCGAVSIDSSSFYFLSGLLFAQKVILPLTFLQYSMNSLQDINNIILKSLDDYFLIPNEEEE